MLLDLLEFDDAFLFASHNYNLIPVSGELKHKKEIVEYINKKIEEMDDHVLNSVVPRAAI